MSLKNPRTAVLKSWISTPDCVSVDKNERECIQCFIDKDFASPNSINFTADEIYTSDDPFNNVVTVGSEGPVPNTHTKPLELARDFWKIPAGASVMVRSNFYLTLPYEVSCQPVTTRSSLLRLNLELSSGTFESGYRGHIQCFLHNNNNKDAFIKLGALVGQIQFIKGSSWVQPQHNSHYENC